jgi:hypothetical protein
VVGVELLAHRQQRTSEAFSRKASGLGIEPLGRRRSGARISLVIFADAFEPHRLPGDARALRVQVIYRQLRTTLVVGSEIGKWPGQRRGVTDANHLHRRTAGERHQRHECGDHHCLAHASLRCEIVVLTAARIVAFSG